MDFDRSLIVTSGSENLKVFLSGDLGHDVLLLHHGAGYTAKTWLALISQLRPLLPNVCFVAWDMRGHGQSVNGNGNSSVDMSLDSLVSDVNEVLQAILAESRKPIDFFLVGHSLGAAVLAAFSAQKKFSSKFNLHGLVLIDIIEDTAVAALERMPTILSEIPSSFASLPEALKWTLHGSHSHHFPGTRANEFIKASLQSQLMEQNENDQKKLTWIADLASMQPFWSGWFTGLTENFLSFSGSRMLVLAGTDYMDRKMTVAQMQGKFQLVVVRESGHAIQEDQPAELARPISSMIEKHLKLLQILRSKAEK